MTTPPRPDPVEHNARRLLAHLVETSLLQCTNYALRAAMQMDDMQAVNVALSRLQQQGAVTTHLLCKAEGTVHLDVTLLAEGIARYHRNQDEELVRQDALESKTHE